MLRLSTLFWILLVSAAAAGMYAVKYRVQGLEHALIATEKATIAEQHEIRVLDAEWTYLNRPESLAQMNARFLSLVPITAKELRTSVADIPMRPASTTAPKGAPMTLAAAAPSPRLRIVPAALEKRAAGQTDPAAAAGASPAPPVAGRDHGAGGPARRALETGRTRLVLAAAVFVLLFAVVAGRAVQVMLFGEDVAGASITRFRIPTPPLPDRVDIVDRNGRLLATSLGSPSLYADPRQVIDAAAAVRKLATVFPGLDRAALYQKLTSGKSFVWIKRRLTPRQEAMVNDLGIPGLQFDHEERRIYPYGDLFAHVVGYTGIDNRGFAGVERAYDSVLKKRRQPLQLSLDVRLQYILREEVARVIRDFSAIGGGGIIMNVNTGEI